MRRRLTALTALALTLVSLSVAGPASAGGPTSALLVAPGTGKTASLYASDVDYADLAGLVGAFDPDGAAGRVDGSGADHEAGQGVTVTWLIHDVTVWRVDQVFASAEGGPWIATRVSADGSGSIWDSPVTWHTSANGPELTALLDRLGVGDGAGETAGEAGAENVGTGSNRSPGSASSSTPAAAATGWGLAGLALGAGLTAAGVWLRNTLRASARRDGRSDPANAPAPSGT